MDERNLLVSYGPGIMSLKDGVGLVQRKAIFPISSAFHSHATLFVNLVKQPWIFTELLLSDNVESRH